MKVMVLPLMLLTGCVDFSSMDSETKAEEIVYQVAHAVDVAQTVHAFNSNKSCFREAGQFGVWGRTPNTAQTLTYWVVTSYIHAAVTSFLVDQGAQENREGRWLIRGWEVISFGGVANTVHKNYDAGARLFEPNRCGEKL